MEIKSISIIETIEELIGNIQPIGEINADNESFDNLKIYEEVASIMLYRIESIAYEYINSPQYSISRTGEEAAITINEIIKSIQPIDVRSE